MDNVQYEYWQDEDMWIGYLDEFHDYMTQGESIEELEANLHDLYINLKTEQSHSILMCGVKIAPP